MTVSERQLKKLARSSYNRNVTDHNRALAAGVDVSGAAKVLRSITAPTRYLLVFPDSVVTTDGDREVARIKTDDVVDIRHEHAGDPHPTRPGGLEPTVLVVTGSGGTTIRFEGHWSQTLHARLLLENGSFRRDDEAAHSADVMALIQQERPHWTKDRRTPEQRKRSSRKLAAVLGVAAVAFAVSYYGVQRSNEPAPPTSDGAAGSDPVRRETRTVAPGGAGSDSALTYPGDVDLFERGLNIAMPWTAEIRQSILVDSAQRICAALDRTGDPVAARDLAIEFGFQFQDTATFVEDSVAFFCPQFRSLVPQMSNP